MQPSWLLPVMVMSHVTLIAGSGAARPAGEVERGSGADDPVGLRRGAAAAGLPSKGGSGMMQCIASRFPGETADALAAGVPLRPPPSREKVVGRP